MQRYYKFLNCANFSAIFFQEKFQKFSKTKMLFAHYVTIKNFINRKSCPKVKIVENFELNKCRYNPT